MGDGTWEFEIFIILTLDFTPRFIFTLIVGKKEETKYRMIRKYFKE